MSQYNYNMCIQFILEVYQLIIIIIIMLNKLLYFSSVLLYVMYTD